MKMLLRLEQNSGKGDIQAFPSLSTVDIFAAPS